MVGDFVFETISSFIIRQSMRSSTWCWQITNYSVSEPLLVNIRWSLTTTSTPAFLPVLTLVVSATIILEFSIMSEISVAILFVFTLFNSKAASLISRSEFFRPDTLYFQSVWRRSASSKFPTWAEPSFPLSPEWRKVWDHQYKSSKYCTIQYVELTSAAFLKNALFTVGRDGVEMLMLSSDNLQQILAALFVDTGDEVCYNVCLLVFPRWWWYSLVRVVSLSNVGTFLGRFTISQAH